MVVAEDILCNKTHEYVMEKDGYYYIGLTDYFIKKMEEIVFLDFAEVGSTYAKGEIFGNIQGVNSSKNLYMPIGGTILEVNEEVVADYDNISENSWLIKIESKTALSDSSDLLEYEDYLDIV